jgi:hypothetical protein
MVNTMNTKNYTPNFKHKLVRKRVKKAVGFTLGFLHEEKEHELSHSLIVKHFGHNSKELSQYLRRKLLHCTDYHYSKADGKAKKYTFNRCGVEYIKFMIDYPDSDIDWKLWQDAWGMWLEEKNNPKPDKNYIDNKSIQNVKKTIEDNNKELSIYDRRWVSYFLDQEYSKQFLTGKFNYEFKSNRLWNPLQSIKKLYKKPLFAHHNYQHIYDIEACAPTLLLQYARKSGFDKPAPAYERYLRNKEEIRIMIADLIESDIVKVKVFINSLFNGSRIGRNKRFAIFELLDNDEAKIIVLQQDDYIKQLLIDIRNLWKSLEITLPIRYKDSVDESTGEIKKRKLPLSSSDKWNIYFKLEYDITTHIRKYLDMNNIRHFFEHDGWCCSDKIDTDELKKYVMNQSGYDLSFSYEYIDKSDYDFLSNGTIGIDENSGFIANESNSCNEKNDEQPKGLNDSDRNDDYNLLEHQIPSYTLVVPLAEKCNENVTKKVAKTGAERTRLYRERKKALQKGKNIT